MERYVEYETYIPRRFRLDDGSIITLKAEQIQSMGNVFYLYIPDTYIDKLYNHLLSKGFKDVKLSIPKGERYSLSKPLDNVWQMHVRIYSDGFIESEVEVNRDYFEHLDDRFRINVVYEVFEYYMDIYDRLHVSYMRKGWIVEVIDNFRIQLKPPTTLTPWKPITVSLAALAIVGLLSYALSRLEKA